MNTHTRRHRELHLMTDAFTRVLGNSRYLDRGRPPRSVARTKSKARPTAPWWRESGLRLSPFVVDLFDLAAHLEWHWVSINEAWDTWLLRVTASQESSTMESGLTLRVASDQQVQLHRTWPAPGLEWETNPETHQARAKGRLVNDR